MEFVDWLDRDALIDEFEEFDDHWYECIIDGVHGVALTVFATAHEAPEEVLVAIRSFG